MAAPLLVPFIASLLTWLLRDVVVKFVVFSAIFALVGFFVPRVVVLLGNFINPGGLSSAFSSIDSSVWYVLRFFSLDFGVPLVISAFISRFLIRRLPIIG